MALKHLPLMRVAMVARLQGDIGRCHSHNRFKDLLQFDVAMVRASGVAPADMRSASIASYVA